MPTPVNHSRRCPPLPRCFGILLGILCIAPVSVARAQSPIPVTVTTPTTMQCRASLVQRDGQYVPYPCTITLDMGVSAAPGGPMLVRSIHLVAPNMECLVPLQGAAATSVFISGLVIDAAPGAGVSLITQSGPSGETLFSVSAFAESAVGTANFTATGLACQTLLNGGGQCSGPFNLATPGPNSGASILNGTLAPLASGQPRNFSFQFRASLPLVSGTSWGHIDLFGTLSGTVPSGAPACPADFNTVGGLTVQDIFDFLAAWFSVSPQADFNHTGGVSVQDIFDFLGAWFAGCP